jgi:hypothetical protein
MTLVMTSLGRIEKRGERIQDVEFGAEEVAASNVIAAAPRKIRAGEF